MLTVVALAGGGGCGGGDCGGMLLQPFAGYLADQYGAGYLVGLGGYGLAASAPLGL